MVMCYKEANQLDLKYGQHESCNFVRHDLR